MTAIEYLFNELWETPKDKLTWHSILTKAKEMHKRQISKTWYDCKLSIIDKKPMDAEDYYNSTYGSKGSDEHIVDTNEMIQDKEKIKTAKDNSKIGIRWKEYQDWLNEVPEISDEEIEKGADYYGDRWIDAREAFYGFLEGAKWYREQLKTK